MFRVALKCHIYLSFACLLAFWISALILFFIFNQLKFFSSGCRLLNIMISFFGRTLRAVFTTGLNTVVYASRFAEVHSTTCTSQGVKAILPVSNWKLKCCRIMHVTVHPLTQEQSSIQQQVTQIASDGVLALTR